MDQNQPLTLKDLEHLMEFTNNANDLVDDIAFKHMPPIQFYEHDKESVDPFRFSFLHSGLEIFVPEPTIMVHIPEPTPAEAALERIYAAIDRSAEIASALIDLRFIKRWMDMQRGPYIEYYKHLSYNIYGREVIRFLPNDFFLAQDW